MLSLCVQKLLGKYLIVYTYHGLSTTLFDFFLMTNRLQYCLENQPHQKVAGKSGRQSSQKLVSGSQFKLPQREVAPCQNCESLEKSLKKAKEQIRGLKLNSTRLEEKIHDLLRHRSDEGTNDLSAILVKRNDSQCFDCNLKYPSLTGK